MKKIFLIILLLTLIVCIFSLNYTYGKTKVLIIKNMENNKEYIIKAPDNEFILSFIHSVHHTPVYEIFNIRTDNKLILKETRFFSLGVGLPFTEEGGKFINENGEFVLKFSREFDKLNLRISPIPQHAIEVGNMTYSFLEFANPEDQVEIKAADKWVFIKK